MKCSCSAITHIISCKSLNKDTWASVDFFLGEGKNFPEGEGARTYFFAEKPTKKIQFFLKKSKNIHFRQAGGGGKRTLCPPSDAPVRTSNFCKQYCDKKTFSRQYFFLRVNWKYIFGNISVQMSMFWKVFEMKQQYFHRKNIFLLQYLFIVISLYRFIAILLVKITRLTRA